MENLISPQKDYIIEEVGLVRIVLYTLVNETTPSVVYRCLSTLEHSFYHDSTEIERAISKDIDI